MLEKVHVPEPGSAEPRTSRARSRASQVPAGQISRVVRTGVEGAQADALAGCDDGGYPHQDAAHVADQIGGIPPGALRHRPGPVGLGRGEQGAGVFPGQRS